jgi:hypothetical protein
MRKFATPVVISSALVAGVMALAGPADVDPVSCRW